MPVAHVTSSASPIRLGPGRLAPFLLAIETAGSACSAAILRGADVLAAERRAMRHGHAEALLPMIERVASAAGLAPAEIEVVAAAIGPGGFTGIRAGMAAAHGIALASGARLVGVSSFAAVAARLGGGGDFGAVLVALDSRRADLYVQLFMPDGATPLSDPAAILPDRLATHVAGLIATGLIATGLIGGAPLLIAGDACETAAAALGGRVRVTLAPDSAADALGVAAAALRQLQTAAVPGLVRPLYLRPPDVTLPKRREPGPGPAR